MLTVLVKVTAEVPLLKIEARAAKPAGTTIGRSIVAPVGRLSSAPGAEPEALGLVRLSTSGLMAPSTPPAPKLLPIWIAVALLPSTLAAPLGTLPLTVSRPPRTLVAPV